VENYIYKEADQEEENDPDDKGSATLKSLKEYEVSYISGKEIRRLLAKDGKDLTTEDRKKEDDRVDKEIEKYKRQPTKPMPAAKGSKARSGRESPCSWEWSVSSILAGRSSADRK
jgi:hypothetical protein